MSPGGNLKLTSNYKGAVAALDDVLHENTIVVSNTSSPAGLQVVTGTASTFTVTSSTGSPTFDYMCFGV